MWELVPFARREVVKEVEWTGSLPSLIGLMINMCGERDRGGNRRLAETSECL